MAENARNPIFRRDSKMRVLKKPVLILASVCAFGLATTAPARAIPSVAVSTAILPAKEIQAATTVLVNSQLLAMFQAVSVPNVCVRYTYDLNGNRKTQDSVLWGTPGTTWGSAVYGCFSWTP